MAITTADAVVDAIAVAAYGTERFTFNKAEGTPEGVGAIHTFWDLGDIPPGRSTSPGLAGAIPTRATTGAMGQTNPTGGKKQYLMAFQAAFATTSAQGGGAMLYDLLWYNDTMDGTVTGTANSLGSTPSVNRLYSERPGNEMWVWVASAGFGATSRTLTVKYTNLASTTGRTATLFCPAPGWTGAPQTDVMARMNLQAGDTGVLHADTYGWSGTTGVAGDFGLQIIRPLATITFAKNAAGGSANFVSMGMPRIEDDACIVIAGSMSGSNASRYLAIVTMGKEQ